MYFALCNSHKLSAARSCTLRPSTGSSSRKSCAETCFSCSHLRETVESRAVDSRTPHHHIRRHIKPQSLGSEQGAGQMFRFKLRSDAALPLLLNAQLFRNSTSAPQTSMALVTIIRHFEFVHEAGGDSLTLCAVPLGQASH